MRYDISREGIKVYSKQEFNPQHILECGQVFCFEKMGENYIVYPQNKIAEIVEFKEYYLIKTNDSPFFCRYFDLNEDYCKIKRELSTFDIMKKPLNFGYGIRILNQNLLETLISFIVSANNNIKRIKLILNNIRNELGAKLSNGIFSFPSYDILVKQDEDFFKRMGAGYRAGYLAKVIKQISPSQLDDWKILPTNDLRNKLISLAGVGPKVADCILLFGYHRLDVFPVDTWIAKMYNKYFSPLENREKIRDNLINTFDKLAGYAQQYLFYYQRSGDREKD